MIKNAAQIKKVNFLLFVFCILLSFNGTAATRDPANIAFLSLGMAVLLLAVLFFGLKIVSKNLKKIDDSFGEKRLP